MTAIALDDEPPALRIIEKFCAKNENINLLKTFTNPDEALKFIGKNKVDLLFLDIQMPTLSGFEFYAKLITPIPVIFTTAYAEYAVSAFEIEAIDYLLKPFSLQRFEQAVEKAQIVFNKKSITNENYIIVKIDYGTQRINFNQILFIEALDDYVKIYLQQQKTLVIRQTLKSLLEKLPADNFMRVHRSYIVALNKIDKTENKIIYINNKEIPVSNTYELDFNQRFSLK